MSGDVIMKVRWPRGIVVPAVAGLALIAVAGCTSATGSDSPSSGMDTAEPAVTPESSESGDPAVTPMTMRQAADEFLSIVCPTDTALHLVETVYLTEGSWKEVRPKAIQPYTRNAVEAARQASQDLDRDDWPEDVAALMPEVSREYLEMLTPLDRMDQAASGAQMQGPWKQISSLSRTAEQQVRVTLGLSTVGSKNDGCPPAPKVPTTAGGAGSGSVTVAPVTPTDYRTKLCTTSAGNLPAVSRGQSSDDVKLLQWALTQLGYYGGAIGGNYGDLTFEATYRFQLDNGLGRTAPGSVAVNTWSWFKYYLC